MWGGDGESLKAALGQKRREERIADLGEKQRKECIADSRQKQRKKRIAALGKQALWPKAVGNL